MEWRRVWPALVLGAVTLGYFRDALPGGRTFYFRDFATFIYPTRRLLVALVKGGELPLWNPFAAGGSPIAANPEYNLFYPLTLLYYLLPFDLGLTWYVIGHYPLLGGLFYLLARRWGLSPWAALAGAVALMLSGPSLTFASVPNYWPGFAWLPLTLLAADHCLRDGSRRAGVVAAGSLALQALGDPQMVYFTLVALGLQAVLVASGPGLRAVSIRLGRAAGIAIGAGLLAAVQLVPLAELYVQSERRGGLSLQETGAWSLYGHRLLELLYPRLFGDPTAFTYWAGLVGGVEFSPWLLSPYLGLAPLALAAVALASARREPVVRWLAVLLGVSGLLALGRGTGAHALAADWLPLYGAFRYPEKWWALTAFAAAGLTAWGAEAVGRSEGSSRTRVGVAGACLLLALGSVAGGFGLARAPDWAGLLFPGQIDAATRATLAAFVASGAVHQAALAAGALACVGALLVLSVSPSGIRPWLRPALVLLIGLDLAVSLARLAPLAPVALHREASPLAAAMREGPDPFRVFVIESQLATGQTLARLGSAPAFFRWLGLALFPNTGFRHGLHYQRGGGSARLGSVAAQVARFDATGGRLAELALWNVRFVVARRRLDHPALEPVETVPLDPPVILYRHASALPRAWLVEGQRWFGDREALLDHLTSPAFDPRREVLLEGDGMASAPQSPEALHGDVRIVEYRAGRIRMDAIAPQAAVLVLSEAFYPGWRATVGGRPESILRANYAMRALRVPAGTHRVELSYRPWSLLVGLTVTLTAIGLAAFVGRAAGPPGWLIRRAGPAAVRRGFVPAGLALAGGPVGTHRFRQEASPG